MMFSTLQKANSYTMLGEPRKGSGMSQVCKFCEKGPLSGNNVSHSNRKTRTRWLPNLSKVKTVLNGATRTVYACTRCIRSGCVVRPTKRTYKPETAVAPPGTKPVS